MKRVQQQAEDDAAKFEKKLAGAGALQAASGVAFTPESLMLIKDEPRGGTVRRAGGGCSKYRGSRVPVLGVSTSVRERVGGGGGVLSCALCD